MRYVDDDQRAPRRYSTVSRREPSRYRKYWKPKDRRQSLTEAVASSAQVRYEELPYPPTTTSNRITRSYERLNRRRSREITGNSAFDNFENMTEEIERVPGVSRLLRSIITSTEQTGGIGSRYVSRDLSPEATRAAYDTSSSENLPRVRRRRRVSPLLSNNIIDETVQSDKSASILADSVL